MTAMMIMNIVITFILEAEIIEKCIEHWIGIDPDHVPDREPNIFSSPPVPAFPPVLLLLCFSLFRFISSSCFTVKGQLECRALRRGVAQGHKHAAVITVTRRRGGDEE